MDELMNSLKPLIEDYKRLANHAIEQYSPLVQGIISSKTKDVPEISHLLDYMLDFCWHDEMLMLYRRLCRYLYDIDQDAALFYVEAYREMWDEDGLKFGNKKN